MKLLSLSIQRKIVVDIFDNIAILLTRNKLHSFASLQYLIISASRNHILTDHENIEISSDGPIF
jgi:hypothetical protein